MLLYVEWKLNPDGNNNVNILRILVVKDNNIKYTNSSIKYLLGSQTVRLEQDYDTNTIYYTRVKVGSGYKINRGEKNEINILVKEKFDENNKTINIYMFANKAGMTMIIKELYSAEILSTAEINYNEKQYILDNIVKELKKYNVVNINCNNYLNYIYKITTQQLD